MAPAVSQSALGPTTINLYKSSFLLIILSRSFLTSQLLKIQLKLHMLFVRPYSLIWCGCYTSECSIVLQMPRVHQPKAHCAYGLPKCHAVETPPRYPSTAQQGSPASSTMRDRLCQAKALLIHIVTVNRPVPVTRPVSQHSIAWREHNTCSPVSGSGQQLSINT